MNEVVNLANGRDYHTALVRLWVLAMTRPEPDDDLPLNAWERGSERRRRTALVRKIRSRLNDGQPIDEATARDDPLALIVALDEFLGLDTPAKGVADEPIRIDERDYWLIPLNLTRSGAASSARQANNPQSWFHHHRVVPATLRGGLRVEPQASRDVTDMRLREIRGAGHLRTFLGHFDDHATLQPAPDQRFFATGLSDEARRAENLDREIARARDGRADVVVFPELTVTPARREAVKSRLHQTGQSEHRPALIVLGSFHEERGGRRVNACELLAGDGRRLLVHEKLRPFGDADGMAEDIHAANTLRILVTPIGSIALVICKDYCDEAGPIRDWDTLAVDWWLVPSMGNRSTVDAHLHRATRLWTVINRAVTLLANQETAVPDAHEFFPGFVFDGQRRDVPVGGEILAVALDPPVFRRVK